ncbi:MerR family transcriptional regulator [Streptomyces monomycini]|uniref:MerR family transcriptional regulator n=1 Tax=Streptomyces monomycini TaxID=371720 RepID=UPI000998A099|nr:MerR family transcriptional regulator [Streptomyces monomycini]
MLTIGELASYAGVTVRAVRHYHAKGLLPEPERDRAGYRRYDAGAVVALIKIRTLAGAGIPLGRVRELLHADEEEFTAAITDIDKRLRAEILERRRHREQIARLVHGDGLALPPEVVEYLDRLRALGVDERIVQVERDGWIPLAALSPERIPEWMARKREQITDPRCVDFYLTLGQALDRPDDDPALSEPGSGTDLGEASRSVTLMFDCERAVRVRPRTPCRQAIRIDTPAGVCRPLLRSLVDGDGAGHADRCTVLGLAGVRRDG